MTERKYCDNPADPAMANRFWNKVDRQNGCWPWTGYIDPDGYGAFPAVIINGKKCIRAARIALWVSGHIIEDGLVVDHVCRNRSCVNPAHLRQITNKENVLSGVGATARNAAKQSCKRGHPLSGDNLMVNRRGERNCLICRHEREAGYRRKLRNARREVAHGQ